MLDPLEFIRNEILLACSPGKKANQNVELILVSEPVNIWIKDHFNI